MADFTVTPISLEAQRLYAARARAMRSEVLAEGFAGLASLLRGWLAHLNARRPGAARA